MKVVVVTGSTRGFGRGLAEAFLQRGCAVVINGRSAERVAEVAAALEGQGHAGCVLGAAADVSCAEQVQALWDAAYSRFGRVDIWINNAGLENRSAPVWSLEPDELRQVVDANLTGALYGCRTAWRGMRTQPDGGQIYLMEGMGSDGRIPPGLTPYATTKAAIRYLTKALTAEAAGTAVQFGALSPGMVLTDLLLSSVAPERMANAKRIFNILADRVETVAPWMADQILANRKPGARIEWLTRPKIFARFALAPFRKRDLFGDAPAR